MSCVICEKRKEKRFCPAVHGRICPQCCGEQREVTLDCPSDCNWERMPDLTDASGNPFPVGGGSAFFLHGRLYYMGGFSGVKSGVVLLSQLDGIASGDVVSGPWTELASFSPPLMVNNGEFDRIGAAGFGFGSFLYVAGGTRATSRRCRRRTPTGRRG